jgi:hypothetical protein
MSASLWRRSRCCGDDDEQAQPDSNFYLLPNFRLKS